MKPWTTDIKYFIYNKDTYRPHRQTWRTERRRYWLNKYKSAKGCAHCGITDSRVLTFDHLEPTDKKLTIGTKATLQGNIKDLMGEVRKCQVLCHNCHRIKTIESKEHVKCVNDELRELAFNTYNTPKTP